MVLLHSGHGTVITNPVNKGQKIAKNITGTGKIRLHKALMILYRVQYSGNGAMKEGILAISAYTIYCYAVVVIET